ncbi:hypothetical protein D3C78_1780790 [compost metagenome]
MLFKPEVQQCFDGRALVEESADKAFLACSLQSFGKGMQGGARFVIGHQRQA